MITGGNGVAQEEHGGRQGMPNGVRVLIGGHGAEHGDSCDYCMTWGGAITRLG